jgi:hypothetical protein
VLLDRDLQSLSDLAVFIDIEVVGLRSAPTAGATTGMPRCSTGGTPARKWRGNPRNALPPQPTNRVNLLVLVTKGLQVVHLCDVILFLQP